MAMIHFGKILFPLILILSCWLFFEVIEFFTLGGGQQLLAWTIVKISVLTSTIIGVSSFNIEEKTVILDNVLEAIKINPIAEK